MHLNGRQSLRPLRNGQYGRTRTVVVLRQNGVEGKTTLAANSTSVCPN